MTSDKASDSELEGLRMMQTQSDTPMAPPDGFEQSPFCFYCGRKTIGVSMTDGQNSYAHESYCPNCGTAWPRLFMDCLAPGCGNSFNHIYSPFDITYTRDGLFAEEAQGVAWCDACWDWSVYRWALVAPGMVRLRISGFLGYRDVQAVKDTVHTS